MHIVLVPALLLALAGPAPADEQPADEREAVTKVLSGYHAALQAGQPEKVLEFIGPTLFMADEKSTAESDRLNAHLFLTGQTLQSWPGNYLKQVGPYSNEFRVLSVSIRRDAAVVITRDTGRNRFRSWKDEEVGWLLGRTSGEWRVVGFIIRDIQLPKE
jgi:hypothetical protein